MRENGPSHSQASDRPTAVKPFRAGLVPRPRQAPPAELWTRGPVDLEIGAGAGLHAIARAKAHPHRTLIAIERTRDKFARLSQRADRHPELTNLHIVNADAVAWVTHFAAPESLEEIFLLYPNPEPKNPARRWARMPFMARLIASLRPGGTLHLATNISAYAEEAKSYMTGAWGLELMTFTTLTGSAPGRTHFERKYLARGEVCYDLAFRNPPAP